MPSSSKKTTKKKSVKQPVKRQQKQNDIGGLDARTGMLQVIYRRMRSRTRELLKRRPHRSFRRTRRRDYHRTLKLPGYWSFTKQAGYVIWSHKKLFLAVVVLYALLNAALVGLASQDTYTQLSDGIKNSGTDLFDGNWGAVSKAVILLGTGILGGINQAPTDAQKIFAPLIVLLIWLTTIWLLRTILSGHKPKLRDGLYNAGAPIIPTFLVSLMFLVQLIPAALATLGFWAAEQTGFAITGVESMVFWTIISLLVILSVYWGTSTFIALIVVTLPGMYPLRALSTAGDMVIGRRLRILLRLLWLGAGLLATWVVVVVPIILLDTWIKQLIKNIDWVPTVPVTLVIMSALSVVWSTVYIYILYRKVVDDDANPA